MDTYTLTAVTLKPWQPWKQLRYSRSMQYFQKIANENQSDKYTHEPI